MRLLAFFKREAVLTVAALCALATMVLVPPDAAYLGYIDLRVLCLLLCLMAVVAGFQSCGAFQWLAGHLLSRGTGPRALAVILVLLPFFCSMAVTNDVALITFAPFALLLLDQMDCRAAAVPRRCRCWCCRPLPQTWAAWPRRWAIPRTSTFTGPMDSLPGIFSRWCCPWRGSVWPA